MAVKKSHFPAVIRLACVLAAVLVPTALALRGAWSLGTGVVAEQSQDNERIKNQEIRGEMRSLSDEILNEIELVKVRAISIVEQVGLSTDLPGLNDGSVIAVAEVTKNIFVPSFLKNEISAELPKVVEKDIQNSGLSLFPVAIKTVDGGNAYGIAFEQESRKFLAIINPLIAFKGVTTWANGKEGELLTGFLIDSRGQVLVHSDKVSSGGSFSNQEIFQKAIEPVFRGQRVGGVGFYSGVRASYEKFRSLPFVVVAERVPHVAAFSSSQLLNSSLRNLKTPLFSILGVLALACVGSIFIILTAFGEFSRPRSQKIKIEDDAVLNHFTAEQLRKAEEEFAEKTKEIEFLRDFIEKSDPELNSRKPS
jgi:hypothetical protein